MGRIIDPTNPNASTTTLTQWLHAYTCSLECAGDAADNTEIKRSVADNVAMLKSRVKEEADPQAQRLLESQLMIQRQMFAYRPEMYRLYMELWRRVSVDIRAYEWDLTQPVHYHESFKGGPLLFWQGDPEELDAAKKVSIDREHAVMAIKFLKFVATLSETSNPIEYTKQMLMKQGVNAENFHLHADKIAFPNPWLAS